MTLRKAFLIGAGFGAVVGFLAAAYVAGSNAKARAANCANLTGEAQLRCVTRDVNARITATDDLIHYGVADRWVENPADGKGDCEDYALTKARLLETLGWAPARMRLAVIRYGAQPHAVLLIDDTYVLDNFSPWVGRLKDYRRNLLGVFPIDVARSLSSFAPWLMVAATASRRQPGP